MPSLFEYCVRKLGYSEGQACRRIKAARAVRKFPALFEMFTARRIHVTNLAAIARYLTDANHEKLAKEVGNRRRWEVETILATWFPKADVCPTLKLLNPRATPAPTQTQFQTETTLPVMPTRSALPTPVPLPPQPPVRAVIPAAKVEARSARSFGMTFALDEEAQADLRRAQALKGSADLNALMKRALRLLREEAERDARAKTDRPQSKPRKPADESTVTAAAKRAVYERYAEQCTYGDDEGQRCPERERLEVDHVVPKAKGGRGDDVNNLRLRCRAHNRLAAEEEFGRPFIARKIANRKAQGADAALVPESLA